MIEVTSDDLVVTYMTVNGGEILARQFDFSRLVEMKRMGCVVANILDMYILDGTGTLDTSSFAITNQQINRVVIDGVPIGQAIGFLLQNIAAQVGTYQLWCKALLSNDEQLLAWMNIQVEEPQIGG